MATALHPPGPKSRFPGGQMFTFRRDPLAFLGRLRTYGDVVSYTLGPERVVFVNHPDAIRDVLVTHQRNFTKGRGLAWIKYFLGEGLLTSEGDFHRRQRRLVQPAFHRQRVATYGTIMTTCGRRTQQRWQPGTTLDMAEEMMHVTLAIASKTFFDADIEADAKDIGTALTTLMEMFPRFMLPFMQLVQKLPLPSNRRAEQARRQLDAIIYRLIKERRASGRDAGDLLSMLLMAQDDEGDGTGMSDQQLRDEAMTLILAGHETTANWLTWTWYLLSQHPDVEARLHAELATVLGGRVPTVDDIPPLSYTRMVLTESLRLYPPAWIIGRRAINDYAIGPYHIPARTLITMSPYVIQHDARYYPDPAVFDPQRWLPATESSHPKFAFFPFGGGPRQCIGESFAWMEATLLLATLAQLWQLRLAPGHTVTLQPLITLRPRDGMRMVVTPRGTPDLDVQCEGA